METDRMDDSGWVERFYYTVQRENVHEKKI